MEQTAVETAKLPVPKELSPLPFTYVKVDEVKQAAITVRRATGFSDKDGNREVRADQDLLQTVKNRQENKEWYYRDELRGKPPSEQINFLIDGSTITLYNFNKDLPFTDEHVKLTERLLQNMLARFPLLKERLRWILLDDNPLSSVFDDTENYPENGFANAQWKEIKLTRRGMELSPHRVRAATNFEGTIGHELTHLILDRPLRDEWHQFPWHYVDMLTDKSRFEKRKTPGGKLERYYDQSSGKMLPMDQFPEHPEECVTEYGQMSRDEDTCDSMVAYLYDPALLKSKSQKKYDIIEGKDAHGLRPVVASERIPSDLVRLPEIKPQTVYYYVREPEAA